MRIWFAVAAWLQFAVPMPADKLGAFLAPGSQTEGKLSPGYFRTYRLETHGSFRIELEQGEADFAMEALDQQGSRLRTIDGFGWGREIASFASETGARFLRVRRIDQERAPAGYVVRLIDIPNWSKDDDARRDAEDSSTEARSLSKVGGPGLEKAVTASSRAVESWRIAGDASSSLRMSILRADALNSPVGAFEKSKEVYTAALAQSRQLADPRSEAECLNNRGMARWRLSEFDDAIGDLREALTVWEKLPPNTGRGAALSNLGLLAWETGDFDSALRFDFQALTFLRSLGNRTGESFVLNNIALVQGALGQWRQSIRSFEAAGAGFMAMGDNLAAGRALSNSVRMYLRTGDTGQADANIRRGLGLIERAGDDRAKAENLSLRGEVCAATHRNDQALTYLRDALDLSRRIGDPRGEANALANIGLVLTSAAARPEGISALREALGIYRKIGTPSSQAAVLYHLALAQRDAGDLAEAYASAKSAVRIAETLRGNVASENLRISFLASAHDYYTALIDISMQKGDTRAAWQIAERARARSLLDAVNHPARSPRQEQLLKQLNSESLKLMRGSPDASERARRLEAINAELIRLEDRDRQASAPETEFAALGLSDFQKQLDLGLAIVEYALGDSRSYAWVITRDRVTSFPVPARKQIESESRALETLLGDASRKVDVAAADFRRITEALSKALILPALSGLREKRLVFIPDGALELTPFEVLPIGPRTALIDRFEVAEAPSAAVLAALTLRCGTRSRATQSVALFGDAVFDSHDTRLEKRTEGKQPSGELARLPFSRREVMAIASLRKDRVTNFLDFDARKDVLVSGQLNDYSIIHFSTHGIFDDAPSARPALVFSLFDRQGLRKDGLLSNDEASSLRLSADLVVLSACGTANGKRWQGEGVLSLARAFLEGGAARVLSARWNVDDEASADLLVNFYRGMWISGLTPAAALRRAQLAVRSEPRWRSPFYWASFVLQGAP